MSIPKKVQCGEQNIDDWRDKLKTQQSLSSISSGNNILLFVSETSISQDYFVNTYKSPCRACGVWEDHRDEEMKGQLGLGETGTAFEARGDGT